MGGALTIDVEPQTGIVRILRDENVADARQRLQHGGTSGPSGGEASSPQWAQIASGPSAQQAHNGRRSWVPATPLAVPQTLQAISGRT